MTSNSDDTIKKEIDLLKQTSSDIRQTSVLPGWLLRLHEGVIKMQLLATGVYLQTHQAAFTRSLCSFSTQIRVGSAGSCWMTIISGTSTLSGVKKPQLHRWITNSSVFRCVCPIVWEFKIQTPRVEQPTPPLLITLIIQGGKKYIGFISKSVNVFLFFHHEHHGTITKVSRASPF